MASPRLVFGIISATVSFVLTQPVVTDIVRKYFSSGLPQVLYIAIAVTAFIAIGFCLYLFLQDFYSIVRHRNGKAANRS